MAALPTKSGRFETTFRRVVRRVRSRQARNTQRTHRLSRILRRLRHLQAHEERALNSAAGRSPQRGRQSDWAQRPREVPSGPGPSGWAEWRRPHAGPARRNATRRRAPLAPRLTITEPCESCKCRQPQPLANEGALASAHGCASAASSGVIVIACASTSHCWHNDGRQRAASRSNRTRPVRHRRKPSHRCSRTETAATRSTTGAASRLAPAITEV